MVQLKSFIMIRIILLGIFLIIPFSCLFPQTTVSDKSLKFFNKTEAGVSFGIGSFKTDQVNGVQKKIRNDEIVIVFQTINGFRYVDKLGIGVSIGVEKWQNGLFWPLYGFISYDLKPADNTFYADLYLGYSFGTRYATTFYQEGHGGFGLSIGIGYKMKIASKVKFMYEIFYRYQSIESSYYRYTDIKKDSGTVRTQTQVDYKIPLHFAGFKIGITIP